MVHFAPTSDSAPDIEPVPQALPCEPRQHRASFRAAAGRSLTRPGPSLSTHERLVLETAAARETLLSIPIIRRTLGGDVARAEYLLFLQQVYHHVRHTVPRVMEMRHQLPERLRWMQPAVAGYIAAESSHEQWILDDIAEAGGDAAAARQSTPLPATEMMMAYAHDTIQRGNPVGFLGMVFVLESASAALSMLAAGAIQRALNLPRTALRYLSSHAVRDLAHVGFYRDLVNRIDDESDRQALINAAGRFYELYGAIFHAIDDAGLHGTC
ncbi:iron-containing redox enzyme family protein [Dyella sp. A6]|uniref:iron-containing redox enzyme family protein n=1 Tax=Dyella aluminiiresistens TaxID=3069105 RepID=UPI002E78DC64|nr:iron-containing redox enzyme family protein [Dyella sp. A6]